MTGAIPAGVVPAAHRGSGRRSSPALRAEGLEVESLDLVNGFDVSDPEDVGRGRPGRGRVPQRGRPRRAARPGRAHASTVPPRDRGERRRRRPRRPPSGPGDARRWPDRLHRVPRRPHRGAGRSGLRADEARGRRLRPQRRGAASDTRALASMRCARASPTRRWSRDGPCEQLRGGGFPLLPPRPPSPSAAWTALSSGETGHAWVVQPGRPPVDFRFPTLPGPADRRGRRVWPPAAALAVSRQEIPTHEPPGYACPFCAIVAGSRSVCSRSRRTWSTARRRRPRGSSSRWWERNPGHVIVVPNEHVENIVAARAVRSPARSTRLRVASRLALTARVRVRRRLHAPAQRARGIPGGLALPPPRLPARGAGDDLYALDRLASTRRPAERATVRRPLPRGASPSARDRRQARWSTERCQTPLSVKAAPCPTVCRSFARRLPMRPSLPLPWN